MSVPTVSWDETSPAGSQNINLGDNRIRELKTQVREVVNVDHDFPSSGQDAGNGQHKQVTLQEQADLGTGAVNATILGSQTVGGKGELVYTDEDDNDIQITSGGELYPPQSPTLANWAEVLKLIYPVGSVYANRTDGTNPATLLGFGTWVAIEEETLVGYKSGSAEFGTLGTSASGEKTHTLTEAEMPEHTHTVDVSPNLDGSTNISKSATTTGATTATTSTSGSDTAHNNIQPSCVVYLWYRSV